MELQIFPLLEPQTLDLLFLLVLLLTKGHLSREVMAFQLLQKGLSFSSLKIAPNSFPNFTKFIHLSALFSLNYFKLKISDY
jgi:hypothetical protein